MTRPATEVSQLDAEAHGGAPAGAGSSSGHPSLSGRDGHEPVQAEGPTSAANLDKYPMVLTKVTKRWRKDQPLVLDGVDLKLDLGTRTWIGGRNGAGKTTLLRIAAGLIGPDSGRAQVWGFSAVENRIRYQQLVALLPAGDRGLYARLSVAHQLKFWSRVAMLAPEKAQERIEETLDGFQLRDLASRRVDRMSMGQRQRLRLAMTFLPEPEIVLLDEPLTSLDSEGAEILKTAVDDLMARGGTLLWCSPSSEHLDQEFDARWVLEQGRLVAP